MAGNQSTRSGGVDLSAEQISIGGDVVGRDKIVNSISVLVERALSAAEEAEQAKSFEAQRLAQGVSAFAQRLQARASDTTDADRGGPYKGLLEYRLSDAEIFFGRARAIRELFEHLQRGPLTVLHAESGAGKTSLLQAGISPRLIAAGHLPVHLRPYNVVPSLALKRAFLPNLNDTPNLAQASLRDFLSRVSDVLGSSTTLYIFLDQFEEFFTQLEEQARPEFVRELAECLDDESLNVRWVLALRSEFFGNLATFRPRIRNPFENDYRLNRLTRDEAREAVAEPAARRGIAYEDGLVDTILDDLGKDEVAPPQVQLVCSTLYEVRSLDQSVITRELYAAQGGAAGILRGHLGRVLNRDLPADQRPIAQRLLEALITSDIRRVIRARAELAAEPTLHSVKPETLDAILSQLVDSRLLRVEEVDGELAYEVAHDYLLDEIKLDPAVRARKQSEELIAQGIGNWKRLGTLLGADALALVDRQRDVLNLNPDAVELLARSAAANGRKPDFWVHRLPLDSRKHLIDELSATFASRDRQARGQALVILWSLRDELTPSLYAPVRRRYLIQQALDAGRRWAIPAALILIVLLVVPQLSSIEPVFTGWRMLASSERAICGVGNQMLAVTADPTNPELIYAFDPVKPSLCKSTDGGITWTDIGGSLPAGLSTRGIAGVEQKVYAATPKGLYISDDQGSSWHPASEPLNGDVWAVAVNPGDLLQAYVTVSPTGVFGTSDGGATWSPITAPELSGQLVRAIAADGHYVIAAGERGVWTSQDAGETWQVFTGQTVVSETVRGISALGQTGRFLVALGEGRLYDADVSYDIWLPFRDPPPASFIGSVAGWSDSSGDEAYYVSSERGLLCSRVWFWPHAGWWLWHLGASIPCRSSLGIELPGSP